MNRARVTVGVAVLSVAVGIGGQTPAVAAQGGAQVDRDVGCHFDAGDVPGVDQAFEADCLTVITPSGRALVEARAQLPLGESVVRTFQGTMPCNFFGQSVLGHVIATRSGMVRATCHFAGV